MKRIALFGLAVSALWIGSAWAVQVTLTDKDGDAFPTGTTEPFTATATNVNQYSTYRFTVMDSAFNTLADTTSLSSTFRFTFATQDEYTVQVYVNNGVDPIATDFLYVEAVTVPPATDPPGSNAGDPPQTNPDTGDTFTISDSRDGVVQGTLSASPANTAAGNYFVTDFGDGSPTHMGNGVLHHYLPDIVMPDAAIFILEADDTMPNGSLSGITRKTLAFSASELIMPNPNPNITPPTSAGRKLNFGKIKGKFNFAKSGPAEAARTTTPADTVVLSWTMTLPVGFDVAVDTQNIMIAVGNVVETVMLKPNGVGQIANSPSPYHAVKFKLPRLKKGQTVVTTPFVTTVSVAMSSANLPSQGFDSEGITTMAQTTTHTNGPFARTLQVATTFAGISYTGLAQVSFVVSSNSAFGTISSRH
jgi:hypothetical protein